MCDKADNTSPSAIQFAPENYKSQKMCDKAVHTCPFVFDSVSNQYKTQEMCDKAVDSNLLTSKFVRDWFVTSKMIEKLDNVVFSNVDIDVVDIDSELLHSLAMIWALIV